MDIVVDKTPIRVKWVYKTKINGKGKIEKYKARLVAKGFVQQFGIDYGETFTPVARLDIVRDVLAVTTQNKWPVYQMDVNLSFINGILEGDVYVNKPLGLKYRVKNIRSTN